VKAVLRAADRLPVRVAVVVVLDSSDDGSEALIGQFGPDVHFVAIDARNVGAARAAGFSYARTLCEEAAVDDSRIWYATTDADSVVDPDWLTRQICADADMALGVVRVSSWCGFPAAAATLYQAAYRSKQRPDGHGHVHGANMGFRADRYWRVGGFAALATGEDVDLVSRFESADLSIARDPQLSVVTSRRQLGRAPDGFAAHLSALLLRTRAESA
jgi:glycosyltransferase involved in cell wall biosynthesis